ncbi:hypothetical protein BCR44DRAFT_310067 [Catenaria anguillulae PL171]|uniref:Uncharacterized protein n=1 Tax=Catenaria anguillulae PL171 TaxID=765915 RepID=A0A1Y2HUW1_9FUNG|nr:hypothetical protein BCR44DRAFT_310067 [Catenaria anguillulae PL171]
MAMLVEALTCSSPCRADQRAVEKQYCCAVPEASLNDSSGCNLSPKTDRIWVRRSATTRGFGLSSWHVSSAVAVGCGLRLRGHHDTGRYDRRASTCAVWSCVSMTIRTPHSFAGAQSPIWLTPDVVSAKIGVGVKDCTRTLRLVLFYACVILSYLAKQAPTYTNSPNPHTREQAGILYCTGRTRIASCSS